MSQLVHKNIFIYPVNAVENMYIKQLDHLSKFFPTSEFQYSWSVLLWWEDLMEICPLNYEIWTFWPNKAPEKNLESLKWKVLHPQGSVNVHYEVHGVHLSLWQLGPLTRKKKRIRRHYVCKIPWNDKCLPSETNISDSSSGGTKEWTTRLALLWSCKGHRKRRRSLWINRSTKHWTLTLLPVCFYHHSQTLTELCLGLKGNKA